jgi:hypothetical protein
MVVLGLKIIQLFPAETKQVPVLQLKLVRGV